jgi:hypothetical protein
MPVFAAACVGGMNGSVVMVAAPIRALDVPPADYGGAAWLPGNILVLGWAPPSGETSEPIHLVELTADSRRHETLPFARSRAGCWRIEEADPIALHDGRLGFLRACQPTHDDDASVTSYEVVAVDLRTQAQEVVARLGEVSVSDAKVNIYSLSFGADISHGVMYVGSKICDSVVSFDAAGIYPLNFRLDKDRTSSNLADAFTKPCQETVNARSAALSPDGERIAMFIAEGAKGSDGAGRLDAKFDLVVIRPSDGSLIRLVSGLEDPLALAWSPDGTWLAFNGAPIAGKPTVMLVRPDKSQLVRLDLDDHLSDLTWSPTGDAILALADRTDPSGDRGAFVVPVIVDVAKLVEP